MATSKRTFSVTITTASDSITLKDGQASNFWAMYQSYLRGDGVARGFTYVDTDVLAKDSPQATEVLETTILFRNVVSVKKTVQTVTETTDYDCADLDLSK